VSERRQEQVERAPQLADQVDQVDQDALNLGAQREWCK
jgi:hypothetical protein